MTSEDIVTAAVRSVGLTKSEVARRIGWTPNKLTLKLLRNSLQVGELLELLSAIGLEIYLKETSSGRIIRTNTEGAGPGAKGVVDKVVYDTKKSSFVTNDFYSVEGKFTNGVATELYQDMNGRYFFVEYYEDSTVKPRINPTSDTIAEMFIQKYGMDTRTEK